MLREPSLCGFASPSGALGIDSCVASWALYGLGVVGVVGTLAYEQSSLAGEQHASLAGLRAGWEMALHRSAVHGYRHDTAAAISNDLARLRAAKRLGSLVGWLDDPSVCGRASTGSQLVADLAQKLLACLDVWLGLHA